MATLVLFGVQAFAYTLWAGIVVIPERWNPWATLRIDAPPDMFIRFKLARLSADDALCLAVLAEATMDYQALPDDATGPGCGFHNAVRISRTSAGVGEPFALSCRSAVALALWEQHVMQPAAQARFGQPVVRLEHYGSYACRNVYGRTEGRRSQHATADALDVAGFVLADGQRIRVQGDWTKGGAGASFLRAVHDGACPFFDAVLGPDYNAAHRDHFHFDRGSFRVWR